VRADPQYLPHPLPAGRAGGHMEPTPTSSRLRQFEGPPAADGPSTPRSCQ
jgi:hypothetical protein